MTKKLLLLLGLVLLPLGFGASALAGSGSSSSGEYSWTTTCGDGAGEVIFTNSPSSVGHIAIVVTAGFGHFLAPGESWTSLPDDSRFDQWYVQIDGDSGPADSGYFSDCTGTTPPTTQPNSPDEAPELISECRGADWYLVHPDDSPAVTFAYRMSTGDIL